MKTDKQRVAAAVDLPAPYRRAELLAFHGRDASRLAEAVEGDRIDKGVIWRGMPACLTIRLVPGQALAELAMDGPVTEADAPALAERLRRMLGLSQPVETFEEDYRLHPDLGRMIARHPGLRLPVAASPFEALTWAVTGQQISVAVAVSLRRKLIEAAGVRHSGGLFCYPDAKAVLALGEEALHRVGFSKTKARTLAEIGRRVEAGTLPLESWRDPLPVAEISERLLAIPGIGPWTVSYTLLRGFGWLDGSLHGDVAVRRGLQSLLGLEEKPSEKEAERWLTPFKPWRALVAAHLWAWKSATAY